MHKQSNVSFAKGVPVPFCSILSSSLVDFYFYDLSEGGVIYKRFAFGKTENLVSTLCKRKTKKGEGKVRGANIKSISRVTLFLSFFFLG